MAGDREAGGRICLGVMVGAHGVRGLVKVKSFTADPADVVAYGPLSDDSGARRWRLEIVGPAPGKSPGKRGAVLLARVASVRARDAAQALHGGRLSVARAPPPGPGGARGGEKGR